jgi:DNA-binding IclR family transcriptional regulator
MRKGNSYAVPGLRAGILISRLLCELPRPLGLAEICLSTGLNKHMVYRCIQTFLSEGVLIETGEGPRYEPSLLSLHYTVKELEERIGPKVRETAKRISATLGWVGGEKV